MKNIVLIHGLVLLLALTFSGCGDDFEDTIPEVFYKTQLNPDDIYLNNYGGLTAVRLDPLVNDSIKVEVSITYGTPNFGTISFIENEGWFYKPNSDFIGNDKFSYTVCYESKCQSAEITMHVEPPIDLNNCAFEIVGESVETQKDQPIAIRIFLNDKVCPYRGSYIASPEKGTFNTYTYSGSFKNIVYVYYPPKGFVGTDRFKYKLFTDGPDIETYCNITVKP